MSWWKRQPLEKAMSLKMKDDDLIRLLTDVTIQWAKGAGRFVDILEQKGIKLTVIEDPVMITAKTSVEKKAPPEGIRYNLRQVKKWYVMFHGSLPFNWQEFPEVLRKTP